MGKPSLKKGLKLYGKAALGEIGLSCRRFGGKKYAVLAIAKTKAEARTKEARLRKRRLLQGVYDTRTTYEDGWYVIWGHLKQWP